MSGKMFWRLAFGLVLVLGLVTAGCAETAEPGETEPETASVTERETETASDFEEEEIPEEFQKPEEPDYSELRLPGVTLQQVQEAFEEVVLQTEYSEGEGDTSLVQRWECPILYRIHGSPSDGERAVLTDLFADLNGITGFPGISEAKEGEEHLNIYFLDRNDFEETFSEFLNGEVADGAVRYWYYTDTNDIYEAKIGYLNKDGGVLKSVLIEEVINMLGISDTVLRTDSVVYQYSDENEAPSEMDWLIVKLLYRPEIRCGMGAEECREVLGRFYS